MHHRSSLLPCLSSPSLPATIVINGFEFPPSRLKHLLLSASRNTSRSIMPVSLADNKDALVLRLKYHKTTLFLTCQPTTPLSALKSDFLNAVKAINQPALSSLPQYIQADGKDYPDWGEMDASEDIGLFVAGSTDSDALEGMTVYMPLDQDATQSDITVRKAGLKDADAVCIGFRAKGSSSISQPVVQFTDVEQDEDDAVDPNSIPPPLSD